MAESLDQGLDSRIRGDQPRCRGLRFKRYAVCGVGIARVDTLRLPLRDTVPGELFAVALPLLTLPLPCWQQCKSICRGLAIT
ncbi:hypothetical protein D3C86_1960790 [compost metagenome]